MNWFFLSPICLLIVSCNPDFVRSTCFVKFFICSSRSFFILSTIWGEFSFENLCSLSIRKVAMSCLTVSYSSFILHFIVEFIIFLNGISIGRTICAMMLVVSTIATIGAPLLSSTGATNLSKSWHLLEEIM